MKKKYSFLLLIILSSSFFIGCSEYNDSSKAEEENSSITDNSKYDGNGIYIKEINDKIKYNAKVDIPKVDKYPIIIADKINITAQDFINVFVQNENLKKMDIPEGEVYRNDKKSVNISDTLSSYMDTDSVNYATDIEGFSDENVWTKEDLFFMSKKDAINLALEYCKKLNINVNTEPTLIKAIDIENLKSQEKIIRDSNKDSINSFIDAGKIKPRELSEKDEYYIINFNCSFEGIPIINERISLTTAIGVLPACNIEVMISQKGIVRFSIKDTVFTEKSVKEDNPKIISIDEAINKFNDEFNSNLLPFTVEVTKISLEYVSLIPEKGDNERILYPAWCFKYKIIGKDEDGKDIVGYTTKPINAITGEIVK